ncbi:uncharacterized protein J4E87_006139 [Alternaria ethzedia]|uniref:uncharacterized protein n=1 Tax=Alternaria ethzedia TaxID=181014 RepID=UPI0020C44D25|nr:uncharacterized protein J4E87_006139 [Alternaria ethzedia]KAI4623046.1 hypothetical protein J4E87_006139 [Alternaria ethzedia]
MNMRQTSGPLARIGPNDLITSSPDLLAHMNAVRSPYTRTAWYNKAVRMEVGKDHVFSQLDEAQHTKRRQQMASGYSGKENWSLESDMDEHIHQLLDLIRSKYLSTATRHEPVDLASKIQYLTLDVISKIGFGKAFGDIKADADLDDYISAGRVGLAIMVFTGALGLTPYLHWPPIARMLGPSDKDKSGYGKMRTVARELIDSRLEKPTNSRSDMLSSFIRHGLTRDDIVTESMLTILAGSDTTATAIRGTMLYLMTSQRAYKKLQVEIDAAVTSGHAASSTGIVSDETMKSLPYLQAVMREGLRIHPPVTDIAPKKVPVEGDNVTINGKAYFLPGGTNIGYNVMGLNRNKEIFGEDVDCFRPERWLLDEHNEIQLERLNAMRRTTDMIFGYGKYQCLGKPIAWLEMRKVIFEAGIYQGRFLQEFDQDLFLGVKYAPKPVRFAPAQLAPDSPTTYHNVTQYGIDCTGYGGDTNTLVAANWTKLGEDCLHLNIVKPRTNETNLPILLWIYGGGWQQGATSDPRYNMSYIVQQSVLNNKPVIGISINYRMAAFGFLYSEEVETAGAQNLGLRDQRLAMQWVNKHISAFGGDPEKVTIWGESAGAYSVGDHIAAHNGDNEGLFRAAILESGNAVGAPLNGTDWYQHMYDNLTESVGCSGAEDTLQCLRDVPYETIAPYGYQGLEWFHVIDGSLIPRYGQQSLREGKFAKIPLILGTNTDEGFGVNGVNSDSDAINQLVHSKRWNVNETVAEKLLELYPNDPTLGEPYGWGNRTWPQFGLQYKRYQSIATDLTMYAPRRLLAQSMSEHVDQVYSYRWDAPKFNNTPETIGVNHFSEIPFVFGNPEQQLTPLGNSSENIALSKLVMRMWTSFAYDLDPNGHGITQTPQWPSYATNATNFVFRKDQGYIEDDDDRAEGVAYINSLVR